MTTLLAISPEAADAPRLRERLAQAGWPDTDWAPCDAMVQKVAELAPLQVVVALPGGPADVLQQGLQGLAEALRGWGPVPPCALLLWLDAADEAALALLAPLAEAGLHGCLVGEATPQRLRAELQWALARRQREAALQQALLRTRGQLDDRIWVDRAKGVLMSARQIGEDQAFALLRGASMHTNLRVGEVSRAVTEAAQWAEAVNRAGQLRMLSQRAVRLAAQQAAGVEARRARSLLRESLARAQDNLEHLAGSPWAAAVAGVAESDCSSLPSALQASAESWRTLREALAERPPSLARIDGRAELALLAAETLTGALEAAAGRRALRIVNLCGRQRMRVQRVAKEALLALLLQEPSRQTGLQPLLDEFEATLLELERAPLSSPDSRAGLEAAREEWARLLRGLANAQQSEGRDLLARSAEALLDIFDRLTAAYEHSLQVIMG